LSWEGLTPPYATIVADPPWDHSDGWPAFSNNAIDVQRGPHRLAYSCMTTWEIAALPVRDLAAKHAHLYLWMTNRYVEAAYMVARAWGFKPSQLLTWCKAPKGMLAGGAFSQTTEHILFAWRGRLAPQERAESTWFVAKRGAPSEKPPALQDLVERVSPAPRVELFARAQRLGWDSWGWGYENAG
jgi:N6-adenosine-specific RNA methylase IME4